MLIDISHMYFSYNIIQLRKYATPYHSENTMRVPTAPKKTRIWQLLRFSALMYVDILFTEGDACMQTFLVDPQLHVLSNKH
jgi:hypothetical protein